MTAKTGCSQSNLIAALLFFIKLNEGGSMTEEKQNQTQKLARDLKKKKIRKYVLIALAIAVVAYAVSLITIEAPDAKLPDGQGNIVTGQTDAETETQEEGLTSQEAAVDNSEDPTASNKGNVALKPKDPKPVTVTLEIRCDTLSQNMDYLETPAIAEYIPEDGVMLARTEYKGTTDNTVFDALNTLCRNNDIHLEFSFTPLYESNYIEGIGYLYEFDGGKASGWMYKVNNWFPNYGCSSYYLSDGDEIVWCYTCRGYGADVGDDTMNGLTEVKEDE
jgi:hypothetical protein